MAWLGRPQAHEVVLMTATRPRPTAAAAAAGSRVGAPANIGPALQRAGSRSDLKLARISSEKSCGCSQAAKWPPLSSLL